jgi:1-acyl-sn-glycerol-3-phosphate acyltransferase
MNAEQIAQLTLAAYVAAAAGVVLWQALRCEAGPVVWLLFCLQRTYGGVWFHWRSNRRCPFPRTGGALIVANHRSPVDPLMIWMNSHFTGPRPKLRVISFMMAVEYYHLRGIHWVFRAVDTIPVHRNGQDTHAVREAIRRLKAGRLVAIFPEGGINRGEHLREASPGTAFLALSARVPVYPVFIHDSPGGKDMVEPFWRGGRVRVTYGRPIDLSAYFDRKKSHALLVEVTTRIMQQVAELGGVSYGGGDGAPDVIPFERATG